MRQDRVQPRQSISQLLHISAEFLAQRERGRILQMRAANLDDVVERLRFGVEGVSEFGDSGHELLPDLEHGGYVHGCWEPGRQREGLFDEYVCEGERRTCRYCSGSC